MLNKFGRLALKILSSSRNESMSKTGPVLYDDDVFLASFPKSGNTWMRFLLANYISGDKVDLPQSNKLIPDIYYNPQDIVKGLHPRIIKTHDPYEPRYKRALYIVRDGRDVAVSYFHQLKKFGKISANTNFSNYLDDFIEGRIGQFGQWGAHVESWLEGANDLQLIRYEDMLNDTEKTLEIAIRYCGMELDKTKIHRAIAASSLSELRKIEIKQFNDTKFLSSSDPATYFFRKGISGDWKNYFNERDQENFNKAFSKVLNRIGYSEN